MCLKGVLYLTKKVKCAVCGKEFEMTNPEDGCPYCHGEELDETDNDRNTIAYILKIFGVISIIFGFIGSIILGNLIHLYSYYDFDYVVMILGWICTAISSLFIFAFAEVIQILHDIRSNQL